MVPRALGEYQSWIIRQFPLSTLHGLTDSTATGVVACAYRVLSTQTRTGPIAAMTSPWAGMYLRVTGDCITYSGPSPPIMYYSIRAITRPTECEAFGTSCRVKAMPVFYAGRYPPDEKFTRVVINRRSFSSQTHCMCGPLLLEMTGEGSPTSAI